MALDAIRKNLDGLSAELKKEYIEKDGIFVLDVTARDGWALEDVVGLKSALSQERKNVSKLKELEKKYEGIDPDEAKALMEAAKKKKDKGSKSDDDDFETRLKSHTDQLVSKHVKETEGFKSEIKNLMSELEQSLIVASATKAITDRKASVDLLLPIVTRQIQMKRNDRGKFYPEVLGEKGEPRITTRTGSQDPMSIDELVEEMSKMDKYAPAFPGSGAAGSGASGQIGRNGNLRPHQISESDARDPLKYRTAKALAEKAGQQLQIAQ